MDVAALHRRMFDAVVDRDWDGLAAVYHPDYTYIGIDGTEQRGADAGLAVAQMYCAAFPDLRFEIAHQHVAGSCSIVELVASGTQDGELAGIPPTGRAVRMTGCNVIEMADGLIIREREYFDSGAMLGQLGVSDNPMLTANHRATVAAIYEAFGRGDVDSILEHLAEDVSWDRDVADWGLPWYDARDGREGVRAFFEVVDANLEFTAFEPVAMLASDDQVAAVIRFELTMPATGKSVRDTEVHLWTFDDDGNVTGFQHVVDQHGQLLAYEGSDG